MKEGRRRNPLAGRGKPEAPTWAAGRAGQPHRRAHTRAHPSRALAPHWRERKGGAARPKTNNLRPGRLCGRAAAWPRPDARRAGSCGHLGHLVPPTPWPWAPRPRPRGAAAGLYWTGPKVEARFCCGRPARTCCPESRGWQGGCGCGGLEDSYPWALEAEAVLSSKVAGAPAGVSSVPET